MKPAEIVLRSAAEREHMAKFARDSRSKAAWRGMAERWIRNAELFERKESGSRPQNRDRKGLAAGLTDTSKRRAGFIRNHNKKTSNHLSDPNGERRPELVGEVDKDPQR
jgi:hypothetical protein